MLLPPREAPRLPVGQRCSVCDRLLMGRAAFLPGSDRFFCIDHPLCQVCAEPHRSLDDCPATVGGVRVASEARRLVDRVVVDLERVGVHLPEDVPVELVPVLPHGELGATLLSVLPDGRPAELPSSMQVRVGLDDTLFCTVVAHELTHAWMHQEGIRPVDAETAEGVCEMVSLIWLTHSGSPRAQHGIDRILHNSHPTYRNGVRAAVRAARATSVPRVLAHLRATGRLPDVSPR